MLNIFRKSINDFADIKIGDIIIKNKQIRVQMEKETMGNELSSKYKDI